MYCGNAIVGAVVGENSGRISGCLVSNSSVEARAIDSNNTENSSRYAIVGGVVGKISSGSLKNCLIDKVSIYGYAKKHDKAWSNGWEEAAYVFAGGVVGEYVGGVVINNTTSSLTKLEGSAEYRGNGLVKVDTRSRICLGGVIGKQSNAKLAQSGNICQVSQLDFKHSFNSYNSTSSVRPFEEYKSGDVVGYVG